MWRPLDARSLARACGWIVAAGALAAGARLLGGEAPDQLAVAVGLAAAVGIPGLAVLRLSQLDARLDTVERLAVVPPAALAGWSVALAAAFLLHVSLAVVVAVLVGGSAIALAATSGPPIDVRAAAPQVVTALAAAALAARVQRPLVGDGLFHAGRIRKLIDLDGLSVSGLSSYLHGHPHAGYGFPLLHAAEAGAVDLAGIDAAAGYVALGPAAAFLLGIAFYALGRRVAGAAGGVAAVGLATWDGLARPDLTLSLVHQAPGFTAHVLYPALVLLILVWQGAAASRRTDAVVAAGVLILTLTHPSYGPSAVAAVAGAAAVSRRGLALVAACGVEVLAVAAGVWWFSLRGEHGIRAPQDAIDTTVWVHGHAVALGSTIIHDRFELLVAVAAIPAMLLAGRRLVVPAGLAAGPLALVAFPGVATLVAPIGAGQFRRLWFAIPWIMMVVLVAAFLAQHLSRSRTVGAAAVIAAASIAFQQSGWPWGWPSDVIAMIAATVAGLAVARRLVRGPAAAPLTGLRPAAAPLLALTVAVAIGPVLDSGHVAAAALRHGPSTAADAGLPPAVIRALRSQYSNDGLVVLARPPLAFRLIAEADVYAVALPKQHSHGDLRSHPLARYAAVSRFFAAGTSPADRRRILTLYHVGLVVVRGKDQRVADGTPGLELVVRTGGYEVLRVS